MKIIILGAGRVGSSVAESLVSEANDITVVDSDAARVGDLQSRFDLRGIVGNALSPALLREAAAGDADLLIAVTSTDETNLVACKIAAELFNIPTRIARVRNTELQGHPDLTGEKGFRVSHIIWPEQSVTDYLLRLIEFPEALQVLEFADGRASLIAVRAYAGGPLVSHPIQDLRKHIPNIDTRIVAVFRDDRSIACEGATMIQPGDEVFFLAGTEHIRTVMAELRRMDKPVKRVMLAGGGNIGLRLARALDTGEGIDWGTGFNVKLIEFNKRRCEYLSGQLGHGVLVLNGDATDEDLLTDEGVADCDLFAALTNDDENNIMSALLAKRLGARRTIALINRKSYGDLMQGGQIDIAISPSHATLSNLLRHVRRGDVVAAHSLRRGAAEALEIIAHGDARSSKVIGRKIEDIELPRGATIGALVRGQGEQARVLIAHHDTVIQAEDHLILFVENKRQIARVEKLFQVGVGFF
ncbi:MAG TPA: Trk system potassium transporter TrkA [Burkholderiaceae bacterium]|jgi:trk system potassium uptake protein TrkA|nr:Trk system potassium transporter TrkA [Burkholderiaceae bacterium]